jgi:hypothetical protein
LKNISTVKERILQLIDYKNISKNKFYIETGVSNGILDKKGGLTLETIEKIYSRFPEINMNWLLFEEGEMVKEKEYTPSNDVFTIAEPEVNYTNHNDLAAYVMDNEEELLKNKRFSAWYKTVFQQGIISGLADYINVERKKATKVASGK